MRVLIIGYSGCGKTLAGNNLAKYERRSVSTSDVLLQNYCQRNGLSHTDVLQNKNSHRDGLWQLGRDLQAKDPLTLVHQALFLADNGPDGVTVVTGVRNPDEMVAIRAQKIFDVIIWIERPGCDAGPTDKITKDYADWVVYNTSTPEALALELQALVTTLRS